DLPERRMRLNFLVTKGLRDRGVVHFAVTMFAVADQIHNDRRRKRVAIVEGHAAYPGYRFRVFRVDMENRNRQALAEIGRKARRMQFARHRGEADQIIYDDVDRAAHAETIDASHVQRFRPNALPCERGVAVHDDRKNRLTTSFADTRLLRASPP